MMGYLFPFKNLREYLALFSERPLYPADFCLQIHSVLFPWLLQKYLFVWILVGDPEGG